jgi:drug/metabolite transporter (DMT)-like permease
MMMLSFPSVKTDGKKPTAKDPFPRPFKQKPTFTPFLSMQSDPEHGTRSPKDWLIFFFLCLVWGSSFILIKKGLIAFSADEVAVLRLSISGLAFIPIYFFFVKDRVPLNKLKYAALLGLLGNAVPAILYSTAQTHVESSVAGILNSLTPIFTWLVGMYFFATKFRMNHMTGVLIGFVGAAMIILFNRHFQLRFDLYSMLIVIATISYGISANIVKTHLQDVNPIALTAVALFCVGLPAFGYTFFTDIYSSVMTSHTARMSFLALLVLALAGTALANILFFRLIQNTSAVFGSSVAYLIPVTALGWGLLDGEILGLIHVLGMALILIGVWLLRR